MLRLVPLFLGLAAVASAQSVPVWNFDGTALPEFNAVGTVAFKQPGPRRPDYPRFEQKNEAATFDGKGAHLEIKDAGANSLFDFKNGDAITLEAWVKPDGLRKGENAYVIGKGRTDPKSANPSNQNWALRLRVLYDSACLNFLFASPSGTGIKWHRWTTPTGFANDRRWHHVAVRYEFGKPESIRGWIDGKEIKGSWDMDGETTDAPVVDDAPVWIGSSMGGLANSSFRGAIEAIASAAGRFAPFLLHGVTGSGKTFTMLGAGEGECDGARDDSRGLIQRVFEHLFGRIAHSLHRYSACKLCAPNAVPKPPTKRS